VIPEVSPPTPECPHPEQWHCHDGMATEIEVLDFLGALILMTKAKIVVETGSYHGYGSAVLGRAASANGGLLHTCDISPSAIAITVVRLQAAGVSAEVRHCTGVDLIASLPRVDFAFLDSEFKGIRETELRALLPRLSPGAIIAVHDTSRRHAASGGPRFGMYDIAREHELELISFDTPRGLMLLRRPLA
jgi:predicted O-methyltransferase YrrM